MLNTGSKKQSPIYIYITHHHRLVERPRSLHLYERHTSCTLDSARPFAVHMPILEVCFVKSSLQQEGNKMSQYSVCARERERERERERVRVREKENDRSTHASTPLSSFCPGLPSEIVTDVVFHSAVHDHPHTVVEHNSCCTVIYQL